MKIVVIGLGSMGKRRIRVLQELYGEHTLYGIDSRLDRRAEAESLYRISCFAAISDIPSKVECAFVCTPPLSHAGIIRECLSKGWHVFTELNLVEDGYTENLKLARKKGLTLFLSSTFLYREEMQYIISQVGPQQKWNYIYHIGQYLPDWHPWENYKDFFVGSRQTNGCREILAIELPWLTRAFGPIQSMQAMMNRMTSLSIDYDDNYMIHVQHKNGNKGSLIVDVVSPCAVRRFEAYAERRYLSWAGTPDSLRTYNPGTGNVDVVSFQEAAEYSDGYQKFVVENAYKDEVKAFFDVLSGKKQMIYSFEEDQETLKLISSIGA